MNTTADTNTSTKCAPSRASHSVNMPWLPAGLSPEVAEQIAQRIADHAAIVEAREAFWKRWNEGKKAA